jgi:coenzyme F420-reducing hydrogenase delta subunit
VSGCHPRDCHYAEGNYFARRRLELLKRFLPVTGIDPDRFEYTWVSASEGPRWQHVVDTFTNRIHELPPMSFLDAPLSDQEYEMLKKRAEMGPGCGCGAHGA